MHGRKSAMHVALEISSTWAYTSDATSLKALHTLEMEEHLPLAGANVVRIEVALLEPREPELNWGSCIAVWRAQDYLQSEVLVASTALIRFVVGRL